MPIRSFRAAIAAASLFAFSAPVLAIPDPVEIASEPGDGIDRGRPRCGLPAVELPPPGESSALIGDCTYTHTNPTSSYDPGAVLTFQIVVHVIRTTAGANNVSDALVQSQIDILNEDFQALAGTNGANGNYCGMQFQLATEDPGGSPTTGITRSDNTTWYNDGGSYWNTLAWDPTKYINVYTNSAGGNLGYVPYLPQTGTPGAASDRVVCYWAAFGRNSPYGPPYDQGRTLTHELGHYFGLRHTFDGGCANPASCYDNGDTICDTNPESVPHFSCPGGASCAFGPDPIDNYLDYGDDLCMEEFTVEQLRRMRCTVMDYRSSLPLPSAVGVLASEPAGFQLLRQNVPNPFSPATRIAFQLPRAGDATLRVLDVTGRLVRTLASGQLGAGPHNVTWNGTDSADDPVAAGVYFYRLETNGQTETRRMVKTD